MEITKPKITVKRFSRSKIDTQDTEEPIIEKKQEDVKRK